MTQLPVEPEPSAPPFLQGLPNCPFLEGLSGRCSTSQRLGSGGLWLGWQRYAGATTGHLGYPDGLKTGSPTPERTEALKDHLKEGAATGVGCTSDINFPSSHSK